MGENKESNKKIDLYISLRKQLSQKLEITGLATQIIEVVSLSLELPDLIRASIYK